MRAVLAEMSISAALPMMAEENLADNPVFRSCVERIYQAYDADSSVAVSKAAPCGRKAVPLQQTCAEEEAKADTKACVTSNHKFWKDTAESFEAVVGAANYQSVAGFTKFKLRECAEINRVQKRLKCETDLYWDLGAMLMGMRPAADIWIETKQQ
ncbi:MAG: hypothetical protein AAGF56_02945 [Pseudomonadota bacterium]